MTGSGGPRPRTLWAIYSGGFFSFSLLQLVSLAVPLWLATLSLSPVWIGIILGSRSILGVIYAIHLGVLMDSIGIRRVLIRAAAIAAALPLLYPVVSSAPVLVAIQLAMGLATTLGWLGCQALIGSTARDDARAIGRFSFLATAGNCLAPLLLGLIWDLGGPWLGFGFLSLWSLALLVSILLLPPPPPDAIRRPQPRDLLPKVASFGSAFQLLRAPEVRFVVALSGLRIAFITMQDSFYAIYLGSQGFSAVSIGMLVACSWIVSTPAALLAAPVSRLVGSERLTLIASTMLATLAVAATPALGSFWSLALAACLFGVGQGIGFPLVISMMSQSVAAGQQGLSAGLRVSVNRLVSASVPIAMGLVSYMVGIATSFWVMGAALMLVLVATLIRNRAGGAG